MSKKINESDELKELTILIFRKGVGIVSGLSAEADKITRGRLSHHDVQ